MNILKTRRLKYYLSLTYPVRVIDHQSCFVGEFPDLPGCSASDQDLQQLYVELEANRRQWIAGRVAAGQQVPLPNSHLQHDDAMAAFGTLAASVPAKAEARG